MNKIHLLIIATIGFFMVNPFVYAADWDRCKVCHRPSGKPAPSKQQLLEKYLTVQDFVESAKAVENPMMAFVKENDKLLENVANEIGIGKIVTTAPEDYEEDYEGVYAINAKKIIMERCTTCHNINRVVYAPEYSSADWLHITARMESQQKGLLTAEEMMAVTNWLYAHHGELKPVEVSGEEALTSSKIPQETRELLVKNKCIVCHADDAILEEAGVWTKEAWQHNMKLVKSKTSTLEKKEKTQEQEHNKTNKDNNPEKEGKRNSS